MKSLCLLVFLVGSGVNSWAESKIPGCLPNEFDGGEHFYFEGNDKLSIVEDSINGGHELASKKIKFSEEGKPGLCKLKVTFDKEDKDNNLDFRINLSSLTAKVYSIKVDGKSFDPEDLPAFCINMESIKSQFPNCTNSSDSGSPKTSGSTR